MKPRKFKKKLASKVIRKKDSAVFSVEFIRKETLEKVGGFWNKLISKAKRTKPTI